MINEKEKATYIENGQSHIAQILKEFEMGCDEAIIRREGKRLILEPKKRTLSANNGEKIFKSGFPSLDITLFGDFRL